MKFVSIIFLLGFVAIAVFGFVATDYDNHNQCIVAIAQGGSLCHSSALDFVVFHIGTLKSFSLAILDFTFLTIAVTLLFLAFIATIFDKKISDVCDAAVKVSYIIVQEISSLKQKIELSHWLALREKRDPSLSF